MNLEAELKRLQKKIKLLEDQIRQLKIEKNNLVGDLAKAQNIKKPDWFDEFHD